MQQSKGRLEEVDKLARGIICDAISSAVVVIILSVLWVVFYGWFGWYLWVLCFFMALVVPLTGIYGAKQKRRCTVLLYAWMCGFCLVICVVSFITGIVHFARNGGFFRAGEYLSAVSWFLLLIMWMLLGIAYLLCLIRAVRMSAAIRSLKEGGLGQTPLPVIAPPVKMNGPPPVEAAPTVAGAVSMKPPAYDDRGAYVV